MSELIEIVIPDIGSDDAVDVIDILVKEGQDIEVDTPLLTLESEKASMDVPSPSAGSIAEIKCQVGDKVKAGDVCFMIKTTVSDDASPAQQTPEKTEAQKIDVPIPDMGDAQQVNVIEVLVSAGSKIEKEQALVVLEGEKASMDVPSPYQGQIEKVWLKVGDTVSTGTTIVTMLVASPDVSPAQQSKPQKTSSQVAESHSTVATTQSQEEYVLPIQGLVHATPSVRRIAREFGVDIGQVKGTGRKGRVVLGDVQHYVKIRLQNVGTGLQIDKKPLEDFSRYGDIESKPLPKIKKYTAKNVHQSWIQIPHVTHFDETDMTDLESRRKSRKKDFEAKGLKLTPLVFIMKAACEALKAFPSFNASLDDQNDHMILKKYYHIGIAVDTPNGLVVPVIRDVDTKSVETLSEELATISQKARETGLTPKEMSGSSFTVSSLGGIGGVGFTPIIKSPDVAIMGISKAQMKPVYQDGEFKARLILPFSLSYDHRIIDGAEAARFCQFFGEQIKTMNI